MRKEMKNDKSTPPQNSFQEAMYSIYLSNWIKENDPERYKQLVREAEEREQKIEDSRKGDMGYAKSVLFETMIQSSQGKKLLEELSDIFWIPSEIMPSFKEIAKEYGLHINFDEINDHDARYYDKEGNITDINGNIKRYKIQRTMFDNRKYILKKLEKMGLEELEAVLHFINGV